MENKILFLGINPFKLNVRHFSSKDYVKTHLDNLHIHDECEIYLNLSGNVGFIAENNVYDIKSGDIFITRPHEYHHCIIRQECIHEHFWITFSPNGNERLLEPFFKRNAGEENLISLADSPRNEARDICFKLLDSKDETEQYLLFLKLLKLITGEKKQSSQTLLPEDISRYIDYINKNFAKPITVQNLADLTFVSVNTLERRFKKYIGITPMAYIQNRRFLNALNILNNGGSVTKAAFESGFPDYSHFISLFKKRYGKTPLQFQKENL